MLRAAKGGQTDGGKGGRSGTQCRAAGVERDLGIRFRGKYRKRRGRNCTPAGVDACPGGQAIQYRKIRRRIGFIYSGVAQYWGVRYGRGGGVSTWRVVGKDPYYSCQRWGGFG